MRALYNTGIALYQTAISLAATFGHTKAAQMRNGWKGLPDIIPTEIRQSSSNVWFHASSMGEFEQARPVLEAFRKSHPDWKVVVTFFSPSGYEVRKDYPLADYICYLPMDTPNNARRFVEAIHPKEVYFVKYDFWYNYMREIKQSGAKLYIFSTIFRPNQYFFKWYGVWFRKQLQLFDHMFVQNQESADLLQSHGIGRCSIAGDTRFDRVHDIAMNAKKYVEIENFVGNKPAIMAGSSWEPDEQNLKHYLDTRGSDFKLILAPHQIHESHIQKIQNLFGPDNCVRFTQINDTPDYSSRQVMIIDTMGMLSSMYKYADIAYIGGGFGQGIHNILEALTFGKPVVFGPNHEKFKEAKDILRLRGGRTYQKQEDLDKILDCWLDNKEALETASQASSAYVEQNLGATNLILSQK